MTAKTTSWVLMGINRTSFFRGVVRIVFLLGLGLLIKLGFWQLSRMAEKKAIEREWTAGQQAAPVPLLTFLSAKTTPKPYQAVLMPPLVFLQYVFLLDNQRQKNQAGYRVFHLAAADKPSQDAAVFLIESDWVPYASDESVSPSYSKHPLPKTGYIRFPSRGLQLSAQAYQNPIKWPLVLQWIDTVAIGRLIDREVSPFWIQFDKPRLFSLSPEKHLGYAIQWFLFAGLWAGYGIFLTCRPQKGVFL
jgi:cytochrome oxidase assembly protein ShyY1